MGGDGRRWTVRGPASERRGGAGALRTAVPAASAVGGCRLEAPQGVWVRWGWRRREWYAPSVVLLRLPVGLVLVLPLIKAVEKAGVVVVVVVAVVVVPWLLPL